jgi:hypothetical protein
MGRWRGQVLKKTKVKELVQVCRDKGVWLVSDETYEYFLYEGAVHVSPDAADGVINIYSFSKAYGMAGWRVGYVAYPSHLSSAMLKVQVRRPLVAGFLFSEDSQIVGGVCCLRGVCASAAKDSQQVACQCSGA